MTQAAPDAWIGVALEAQIPPASSHPATVASTPVAVWRGETGPVKVWSDRCPHRGMRLSHGYVEGQKLRCIYHGWGYDEAGQCVSIPAHPALTPPKTICVSRYGAETRFGIVWANLAEEPSAEPPALDFDADWAPVRSLYLNCTPSSLRRGLRAFDFPSPGAVTDHDDWGCSVVIGNEVRLLCAIQPIEVGKTALHAVMSAPSKPETAQVIQMAHRLESLRRFIEAA